MLSMLLFKANGNSDSLKQSGTYFSAACLINPHLGKEKAFPASCGCGVCFYFIGWFGFFPLPSKFPSKASVAQLLPTCHPFLTLIRMKSTYKITYLGK